MPINKVNKVVRFISIYGMRRTIVKVLGRTRPRFRVVILFFRRWTSRPRRDIAIIGCGQFAFGTVGYFVVSNLGERFSNAFDIDNNNLQSFCNAYGVTNGHVVENNTLPFLPDARVTFITSNHSSHTPYAIQLLSGDKSVYVEKPVSVTTSQLLSLQKAYRQSNGDIFFGYNRPFSKAIKEVSNEMDDSPFTLTCAVAGHFIPDDHWYRNPEEGTRICGNLGHWLDLAVFLLNRRGGFNDLRIFLCSSDKTAPDDNLAVSMCSEYGDLINITLSSRAEPFEGIRENIFFQQSDLLVTIDDFRTAVFQRGGQKNVRKYKPKDVGHESAVMQPFWGGARDPEEVFLSSQLMLRIMEMAKSGETQGLFSVTQSL